MPYPFHGPSATSTHPQHVNPIWDIHLNLWCTSHDKNTAVIAASTKLRRYTCFRMQSRTLSQMHANTAHTVYDTPLQNGLEVSHTLYRCTHVSYRTAQHADPANCCWSCAVLKVAYSANGTNINLNAYYPAAAHLPWLVQHCCCCCSLLAGNVHALQVAHSNFY